MWQLSEYETGRHSETLLLSKFYVTSHFFRLPSPKGQLDTAGNNVELAKLLIDEHKLLFSESEFGYVEFDGDGLLLPGVLFAIAL